MCKIPDRESDEDRLDQLAETAVIACFDLLCDGSPRTTSQVRGIVKAYMLGLVLTVLMDDAR